MGVVTGPNQQARGRYGVRIDENGCMLLNTKKLYAMWHLKPTGWKVINMENAKKGETVSFQKTIMVQVQKTITKDHKGAAEEILKETPHHRRRLDCYRTTL